ncbi:transposase [Streptomyces sp. NBC_01207]|uniref:transposase n=1 Tax=Streptomyces sp. NBC_01207 TaxID=2903772 RepID=UPI002E0FBF7A|nr:transposase [Streptomyces sp. NBC_01207]
MPARAPRILGIDEFAFRKGRTYGTVLVDVESSRPVDVLPDRETGTVAAWLREHPGAEIICRDRLMAFTKAIRQAAPDAPEVADRWHLLQDLSLLAPADHSTVLRLHRDVSRRLGRPVPESDADPLNQLTTERATPEPAITKLGSVGDLVMSQGHGARRTCWCRRARIGS